jgi:hypothetical protein
MTARPATFRQVDITRAIKGAQAAGLIVASFGIDKDGRITIIARTGEAATGPITGKSEFDQWSAKRAR